MKKLLSIILSVTLLISMTTAAFAEETEEKNLQYPGDYSAIVSFYEYGDGVISAHMSFVKNGVKDNIFSRIYEITSTLGENSIKFEKVER